VLKMGRTGKIVKQSYKCYYCDTWLYSEKARRTHIKEQHPKKQNSGKTPMKNITINIPDNYDKNIQKLIKMKLLPSRSEAIRTALREFLNKEYDKNLDLLGFFDIEETEKLPE